MGTVRSAALVLDHLWKARILGDPRAGREARRADRATDERSRWNCIHDGRDQALNEAFGRGDR
jgi:hypothetical protein